MRAGELVVLPTDTVYGVGADAFNPAAVHAMLSAKGRGPDVPVGVLVGSTSAIDDLVVSVPVWARLIIGAFWPGDVSIVLRHVPALSWDLGDVRGTVMLRMPRDGVALELLREAGPMAVSSANRSGNPPAADARAARRQLGDAVAVYLDGGSCGDPVPSTIVDLTRERPIALREGAVSLAAVADVLGIDVRIGQRAR